MEWLSPPPRAVHGLLAAPSTFHLYYYQDAPGLAQALRGAASNPALIWCTRLYLGYSVGLEEGVERALVDSPYAERIQELELHEVGLTPAQLQHLLRLPALTRLQLTGGISQDWGGLTYEWPSIGPEHLEVLRGTHLQVELAHQGGLTLPA